MIGRKAAGKKLSPSEQKKHDAAEAREKKYERNYKRDQRKEAVANGCCITCVARKATKGYSTCQKCREYAAESAARRREKAKKKRLCCRCLNNKADKGFDSCTKCRERRVK